MDESRTARRLVLSVDLDEWYHSRRWLDGEQASGVPDTRALFQRLYGRDTPAGDIIQPTLSLLDLFDRHGVRCTFFALGEIAEWYPDLVRQIAARGHEIACHGLHHVDVTVLGRREFARQLERASMTLTALTGKRPIGYRAPNLVYEPWVTAILEEQGFLYDSSVCVSRSIGGKYRGWSRAPLHPYHPSYENVAVPGTAKLIELPLPSFPVIRISAGSGIFTRVIGYHWTAIAVWKALRSGDTGYYFHPWEVGPRPPAAGSAIKSRIFLRRTGPWMLKTVERLIRRFRDQIITAAEAAEAHGGTVQHRPLSGIAGVRSV